MARLGIILHGVTGRMGYNQHLVRSILAIRDQGGVALANRRPTGSIRSSSAATARRSKSWRSKHDIKRWSTDLDAALANPDDTIFFDAGTTQMRAELLAKALDAGKHVYCEKPISDDLEVALDARQARRAPPASSTASCRTSCSCPAC